MAFDDGHGSSAPEGRGQLVAGQYRLIEQIGRGGFAVVWRARDERLHRDVAAKRILLPPYAAEEQHEEQRRRALREARSAARLDHRGVVTVHDVVEDGDDPWIIMEFVDGRSLGELVRTHGPLPPERVARIGLQLLDALRAAHRAGVLHRDVKPGNVLIAGDRVVLGDFGLATVEGDPGLTQSGIVMGAPAYTSPERARGEPAVAASDLWSLGATMFYAVEGRRPFTGANPNATLHAILTAEPAPALRAGPLALVLDGLLRKDIADRLRAEEAGELLAAVADPPPGAARRPYERPGRGPWMDGPPMEDTRPDRHARSRRARRHLTVLLAAPVATLVLALLTTLDRTDDAVRTLERSRHAVNTAPRLVAALSAGSGEIFTVAFSPDGRTLVAGGADPTIRVWNVADRSLTATLSGHRSEVFAVSFSPDGRILATAGHDGKVLLWSGARYGRLATLDTGGDSVSALAFNPDGTVLASAGDTVRLWDVPRRRSVSTLPDDDESMFTAAFAPRGNTLATAGTWAVRLWNTTRPARPATVARLTSLIVGMVFSPDGRTLAAGGYDGHVRLWDVATRRLVATLPGLPGRVNSVAFSADGRILACAGGGTVLLWNAATETSVATLTMPTGVIDAVAFTPDGRTLATGGDDATVRLWSLG